MSTLKKKEKKKYKSKSHFFNLQYKGYKGVYVFIYIYNTLKLHIFIVMYNVTC